jgi:site-specific recombinase XerD
MSVFEVRNSAGQEDALAALLSCMKVRDQFEGFLEYRRQMGMDPKTVANEKLLLYGSFAHSIADREINDLKVIDRDDLIQAGQEHGEFGSQRSVSLLRKFMRYLNDSGHPIPFDWRDLEVPPVPKKEMEYLTEHELEMVFNAFDVKKLPGLRGRALCEVLFGTGMRISEALSLDKKDIDWEKREAVIVNAKSKDEETVRFSERSLVWLRRYLDVRTDDHPFLFVSGKGRMPTVTARWNLRERTKKLGIKKHIKNHIFRKSYATHLIEHGVDIIAVRRLLRHKSARTTLRCYGVINQERSKKVHAEIMNETLAQTSDPRVGGSEEKIIIKKYDSKRNIPNVLGSFGEAGRGQGDN